MYDIYDHYPEQYDELVMHEDVAGHLKNHLKKIVAEHSTVIEFGAGTGRVTSCYIDGVDAAHVCDRAPLMLEKAKINLRDYAGKIRYSVIDHADISHLTGKYDVVIEGWAFGHTVHDVPESVTQTTDALVRSAASLLNPGGMMIFIETLGTNVNSPQAPDSCLSEFYALLENRHGFTIDIISTDYQFPDMKEAKRIMGFFFGEAMGNSVSDKMIKEFTGVWTKRV